ncbi:MAG: sulfite exporter TauE/SafE family protein [Candidatus Eisenbacteria bacterium]
MSQELTILLGTAATIGFVHTILGPDHYLPFVVISKARGWSSTKTLLVTALCGVGHVLGSVALGFLGIGAGIALMRLEAFESVRGDVAAWLLMAFGFTYMVWGLHRALRNRPHAHAHAHEDGVVHAHTHAHLGRHTHVHEASGRSVTPWVLFLIFVFGPCEPLIPILMFPAARGSIASVALVAGVFGATTVLTMTATVMAAYYGLSKIRVRALERFGHALAGLAILLSGGAIAFLGL